MIQNDYPFDCFKNVVPVAIEVRKNSESLVTFEHPINAVYVFGPEDGSISKAFLNHCHRFVIIPTYHCTNLAAAIYIVLYDRTVKHHNLYGTPLPELNEQRGFYENDDFKF